MRMHTKELGAESNEAHLGGDHRQSSPGDIAFFDERDRMAVRAWLG